MYNLILAYVLIALVLTGYGVTLYRRTRAVEQMLRSTERSIRALEEK